MTFDDLSCSVLISVGKKTDIIKSLYDVVVSIHIPYKPTVIRESIKHLANNITNMPVNDLNMLKLQKAWLLEVETLINRYDYASQIITTSVDEVNYDEKLINKRSLLTTLNTPMSPEVDTNLRSMLGQEHGGRSVTNQHHNIVKRGLADFVGEGLSWLFGIATDADLSRTTEILARVETGYLKIAHNTDRLYTIVNSSLHEINVNREELNLVKKQLGHNTDAISRIYNVTKDLDIISHMQIDFELFLKQIESLIISFERTAFKFKQQRIMLQMGALNEELLPVAELDKMRIDFPSHKFPNPLWIYAYCKLAFFRQTGDNLIFRTIIPILGNVEFMTHSIFSFPIYHRDNVTKQVIVPPKIAMSQAAPFSYFLPNSDHCMGEEPKACLPAAEIVDIEGSCIPNLIINRLPQNCKLQFQRQSSDVIIYRVNLNEIIIITSKKISGIYSCTNKAPVTVSYDVPSKVHVEPTCTLRLGNKYVVNSYIIRKITQTFLPDTAFVTPLHTINITFNNPKLEGLILNKIKMSETALIDIESLNVVRDEVDPRDADILNRLYWTKNVATSGLSLWVVVAVAIVAVILGVCCWKRRNNQGTNITLPTMAPLPPTYSHAQPSPVPHHTYPLLNREIEMKPVVSANSESVPFADYAIPKTAEAEV